MLKDEVKHLKQLVNHNPDVTRYAIENQSLKGSLTIIANTGSNNTRKIKTLLGQSQHKRLFRQFMERSY